jgi:hypothetical protein
MTTLMGTLMGTIRARNCRASPEVRPGNVPEP